MKVASLITELRVCGVKTFVRVTLNYRLIPAPTNALFYILCVFLVTAPTCSGAFVIFRGLLPMLFKPTSIK
jgi:hypothetical protein